MRQASRRSWRIGQTRPVKVVFMSYRNTLQADALKLVAKKLQSSLAVEGELPEDGLAAYGDDGDDLMMALARKIVSGDEEDAETVEEVFAQARDAESTAEELLVDDGWKLVEVEPEAVEVNGNGHHGNGANGNGHHDAIGIGPTVELFPANGHANGNGNGANGHHDDEALEPQQTLFSWAEFMAEEPVKANGRKRKPQTETLSMFEWAMSRSRRDRKSRSAQDARPQFTGRGRRSQSGVPSPPKRCPEQGAANGEAAKQSTNKEMNQWHAYSYTTTASSPTPTRR